MSFSPYDLNDRTIIEIQQEYLRSDIPWFLGYSGGKDSSALLKLVFIALLHLESRPKPINIVYCDTGVEVPNVRDLAVATLSGVLKEAEAHDIPIHIRIASPSLHDRFFVNVIGRGYPPPSNKFRWCTDRLRVRPVLRELDACQGKENIVLLGIRRGESMERDRIMSSHATPETHFFRHSNRKSSIIYSPIVDYSLEEVWNTLTFNRLPASIDDDSILALYRDASGECPILRDPAAPPCAKGRFGCWTCTVVRRDRAVESMVKMGHANLVALLDFRNWVARIRDDAAFRCSVRRNGAPGPGPFTLEARGQILDRLDRAQSTSGLSLLRNDEREEIKRLWDLDRKSVSYHETVRHTSCGCGTIADNPPPAHAC